MKRQKSVTPHTLLHKKNVVAFEEIVRQEAEKYITHSKKKNILEIAKTTGAIFVLPTAAAGLVGYLMGGEQESVQVMSDYVRSIMPATLFIYALKEWKGRTIQSENINQVIEKTRPSYLGLLRYGEMKPVFNMLTGIETLLTGGAYYGISSLMEMLTGIDFNQGYMALTGMSLTLATSGILSYRGRRFKNRIIDYANNHAQDIEKMRGTQLESADLEALMRGAIRYPDKANKIYIASKEKLFRGVGGAAGFLGALDSLNDTDRDPTRVKPNVTIELKSEGWGYGPRFPEFNFEHSREQAKQETILDITRIVNARSGNLKLTIYPSFDDASLSELLASPYEHMSSVNMYVGTDKEEYFDVSYRSGDDTDSIKLTLYSGKHLDILPDLFRSLYGRPLEDTDFDSELIGLSDKSQYDKASSESESEDIDPILRELKRDITKPLKRMDPLEHLTPKKKDQGFFFRHDQEKPAPQQPEEPLAEIESLPKHVLRIYNENKDKMLPAFGHPSLGIAFEGVVYNLTPMNNNSNGKSLRTALQIITHPVESARSVIRDAEILPGLREAEVSAQISGITRENIYSIIDRLEQRLGKLNAAPQFASMDYDTFWQLGQNPKLLADKANNFKITDDHDIRLTIRFRDIMHSYKTIRDEKFPPRDVLESIVAGGVKENRPVREFEKMQYQRELENPTYNVVAQDAHVPGHVVIYKSDDKDPFMQNSTVHISTSHALFIDTPTHPSHAIQKITHYLSTLRDVVEESRKNG